MAIHRGIQSALFYYLSCAPCADARYRKRRKREAALSRAERLALEEQESNEYRHPGEPSSTNPHWQSEIELGPTYVRRKGKKKANTGDSQRGLQSGRFGSSASNRPSDVDLSGSIRSGERVDSRWKFGRFQREDESLWGSSSNLDGSIYADSIRMPERVRTADSTSSTTYHLSRNPPINDMHPATVCKVERREDVMWMMQPPPVAEVMNGRETSARSRSDSGSSRLSPAITNLSRQASMRLMEQRLRAGAVSPVSMSRQNSTQTASSSGANGQRHDRISEHDWAISHAREVRRPSPTAFSREDSDDSASTVVRKPEMAALRSQPQLRRASSRPQLSTIVSDRAVSSGSLHHTGSSSENSVPTPPRNTGEVPANFDCFSRRSTMAVGDKSLLGGMTQGKKVIATRHRHEDSEVNIKPELFDSWYTPEFELPKWVHEHTKREVKQRWSMDL